MPISVTSRIVDPARLHGAHGYTLLELVVVLAIMGLVTAMVVPSTIRGIDSWRRQAVVDAVMDQVRGLPMRARSSGRPIEISNQALKDAEPPLAINEGWTLTTPASWTVQANGVCQGGVLEIRGPARVVTLDIAAPFCEPRSGEAG